MLAQEVGWPVFVTDPFESASTSVLLPVSLEPIEQDQVWFGSKGKLYCLIKERGVVLFLLYSKATQLYIHMHVFHIPFHYGLSQDIVPVIVPVLHSRSFLFIHSIY